MRLRTVCSAGLVFALGLVARSDDQLEPATVSLREAIRGLNSTQADVRSDSIRILQVRTDHLWDIGIPPCFDNDIEARSTFQRQAAPALGELLKALRSPDVEVASTAADAIAMLGPHGRRALPLLQNTVGDERVAAEVRFHSFFALMHVMPGDRPVGPFLLCWLRALPREQRKEIDRLSKDMQDSGPFSRSEAIAAIDITSLMIARLFIRADRTTIEVPFLRQAASGRYPTAVRVFAIAVLAEFAHDAQSAIPVLQALLHDQEKSIRVAAALALVRIQAEPDVVPRLLKVLNLSRDEEAEFRRIVAPILEEEEAMIEELRANAPEIVPELIAMAQSHNGFARRSAIIALGRIGPPAKDAVPVLWEALKDHDAHTRGRAIEALRRIAPETVDARIRSQSVAPSTCRFGRQ